MDKKYCESVFSTKRRTTREVMIGTLGVGGNNPIRIQSMTNSSTRDVESTIEQILRLAEAGCELVRLTVQGMKEADSCELIKEGLIQRGCNVPLVADIHFFPPAAMRVVDFVEKVRINPGNFVDKRASFKQIDYNDLSYAEELEKIEEKFTPLVEKCKRLKRAMRIGTNHGSLSDRIMNRYGDTPHGMVESALEFARICRKMDYHDFLFSMKASNPQVMIHAYRLLAQKMYELSWDYPLHLGVTEAGEGEDGRVKSAMGIGSLLLDGLGDTIRVSLTEDPWLEMDPCKRIVQSAEKYRNRGIEPFIESFRQFDAIVRRPAKFSSSVPMNENGTVFLTISSSLLKDKELYRKLGCNGKNSLPQLKSLSVDNIVLKDFAFDKESSKYLQSLKDLGMGVFSKNQPIPSLSILSLEQAHQATSFRSTTSRFALQYSEDCSLPMIVSISKETAYEWEKLLSVQPDLIILSPDTERLHYCRHFFEWLQSRKLQIPVVLNFSYDCSKEDLVVLASMECGALLCDRLADGLWLEGTYDVEFLRELSFSILQAARMRMSKTDFISCPSCGRTLFNLQDVTKRIQARTAHLPGVKIAIMGCIVNGPGEMADADFGYVGSKPGKIDLYVGKICVEKDIDFIEADEKLVELIKKYNKWIDPIHDVIDTACFPSAL